MMKSIKIVEISTLENGSHRNQEGSFSLIPDGWAVIPDGMQTENFPFGEITAEEINGVSTVTRWVAGTIPEVEEVESPVSETEQLRADIDFLAIMTGVEL